MIEKICIECNKSFKASNGNKICSDECRCNRNKKYYEKNKEKIIEYGKKHYRENKEQHKKYYTERYQRIRNDMKEYYKAYSHKYRANNKERLAVLAKKYRAENKEKINKARHDAYKKNPLKAFKRRLKNKIHGIVACKSKNKNINKLEIMGCTLAFFIEHMANLFTEGMSWENYGEWHIDHIKPIALAKDEEESIKYCHYTNLQPLWQKDNIIKNDTYIVT